MLSQRSCLGWQHDLPRPALDFAFVGFMKKFVDFDGKYVEKLLNIVVCFCFFVCAAIYIDLDASKHVDVIVGVLWICL